MTVTLADTLLPNGMNVTYLKSTGGDWEIPATYRHIKEDFKNGIRVTQGSTVVDIGANIGLFSLFVHELCHAKVTLYAFEPVPLTFNALETNFNRCNRDNLHAFPFGISAKAGNASLCYYPHAAALSTFHPEHMEAGLKEMLKAVERDPGNLPGFFKKEGNPGPEPTVANVPTIPNVPNKRFNRMRAILGLKTVFQHETISCQVKTLSQVIREQNIQEIDLLKVDVNGSEGDIFNGIEPGDWSIIKQVVVEVPGTGENPGKLTALLKKQGFARISLENQDAVVKGLFYTILYALR